MDTDLLRTHAARGTVVALPPSSEREMSAYTGAKIAGAQGPARGFAAGGLDVLVQAGAGKTITSFFITNKHASNVLEFRLDLLEPGPAADEPEAGVDDGEATEPDTEVATAGDEQVATETVDTDTESSTDR